MITKQNNQLMSSHFLESTSYYLDRRFIQIVGSSRLHTYTSSRLKFRNKSGSSKNFHTPTSSIFIISVIHLDFYFYILLPHLHLNYIWFIQNFVIPLFLYQKRIISQCLRISQCRAVTIVGSFSPRIDISFHYDIELCFTQNSYLITLKERTVFVNMSAYQQKRVS